MEYIHVFWSLPIQFELIKYMMKVKCWKYFVTHIKKKKN